MICIRGIKGDMDQMQRVGSNENLNILVYLNTRFPRQPKVTRKLLVERGSVTQFGPDEARDSGSSETLIEALRWAHTQFPSDQFALILWDHGSGSLNRLMGGCACGSCKVQHHLGDHTDDQRAVCYDFSTGNFLTDADLRHALEFTRKQLRGGKKIDIVAFDACLMADIEIAYTLEPSTDYMVASQEVVPGSGFGYDKALSRVSRQRMSSRELAKEFVYAYEREYKGRFDSYTMAAVDLSLCTALSQQISGLGHALNSLLHGQQGKPVHDAIAWATHPRHCTSFHSSDYVDLVQFCNNLYQKLYYIPIQGGTEKNSALYYINQIINQTKQYTLANVSGSVYPGVSGTSIYFAHRAIDSTYPGLIWSKELWWYHFLKSYVDMGKREMGE